MSKRLILISTDWWRLKDPPSLAQCSLLANLNKHNIPTIAKSWGVNTPNFSPRHVTDFIMEHANPYTDVALGAYVWNEKSTQAVLTDLKRMKFPGRIILGGPQVSYVKKNLEKYYPWTDIFIRGYAENALVKLLQSSEPAPFIKGIHYANTPDLGLSAVAELDDLPSPFSTIIKPQKFIRWETQRGCPFHCSFCQHRESDITMKRRHFNLNRVLQEAQWITENKIIQDVAVLDPTFNSGPNYLNVLDKLIEGKFCGKLSLQCRIEMVKPEFLDRVVELNKTGLVVLEFGLQTIHPEEQKMIDRVSNMRLIEKILGDVKSRHIVSEVSLIFGLPKQTLLSFQQSIDFCKRHQFSKIHAFPLMLLRGTELYYQKNNLGLIESNEIASLHIDRIQEDISHVVASPSFSYEDWKEMGRKAELLEKTYNNHEILKSKDSISNDLPGDDKNTLFSAFTKKVNRLLVENNFWSKESKKNVSENTVNHSSIKSVKS